MRKFLKIFFVIILFIVFFTLLGIGVLALYTSRNVDFAADEELFMNAKSEGRISLYYDADINDGENYTPTLFYEITGIEDNRKWYSYEDFSPYLREGFIAMEDRAFFSHHGVDIKRTVAATLNLVVKGNKSFGGSTITQQVIKNISGDNEKTVKRKLEEIIRAYHIESSHSKEEIFELYLNIIPMGNGVVGLGYASEAYFGKEPSQLNSAEAATLIAIANAPTRYNPYKNKNACKEKRNTVLYVMSEQGIIDEEEYLKVKDSEVSVIKREKMGKRENSDFADTVISDVIRDFMENRGYSYEAAKIFLYGKNAKIYTTMDLNVQSIMEKYFNDTDNFPSECSFGLEFSMVICDSEENLLRGIVGNVGTGKSAYNNALTLHTPASTLKPLALYLPLINERRITCSTVFDDTPVSFSKNSSGKYIEYPKNSPAVYDGLTTVADAVKTSKNTVAVRLYNMLGAEKIYENLTENYHFDSLVYKEEGENGTITDLSSSPLALGQLSRGLSLRKLTEAYTVFCGEGNLKKGRSYFRVYDGKDNLLYENEREENRIADKEAARITTQLLVKVVESGTASKITLKNLYDTAGKTGTSGGNKDKIFVGFTPYYTGGIWCGYPDKSRAVTSTEKNHLTVWDEVMKLVHEKTVNRNEMEKTFSVSGLVLASFCKDSGQLFSEACEYDARGERLDFGYFIEGTEPSSECSCHLVVYENIFPFLKKISLIRAPERDFPKEITVSDEKYVYREKRHKNVA